MSDDTTAWLLGHLAVLDESGARPSLNDDIPPAMHIGCAGRVPPEGAGVCLTSAGWAPSGGHLAPLEAGSELSVWVPVDDEGAQRMWDMFEAQTAGDEDLGGVRSGHRGLEGGLVGDREGVSLSRPDPQGTVGPLEADQVVAFLAPALAL